MKASKKYLQKLYKAYLQDRKDGVNRDNRVSYFQYIGTAEIYLTTPYNKECFSLKENTFNEMLPFLIYQVGYPYCLNVEKYEKEFINKTKQHE
jgi:hypothetical protein